MTVKSQELKYYLMPEVFSSLIKSLPFCNLNSLGFFSNFVASPGKSVLVCLALLQRKKKILLTLDKLGIAPETKQFILFSQCFFPFLIRLQKS